MGAIALWMGEGDRFLRCFGGVRSLWDGRGRSLFEMFWWGAIAFVDQMRSAIAIRNKSAIALSNNLLFS